ncbi:MAG: TIGR04086 family membrane protein [Oscillospiraceae bacterium]
MGKTELGNTKRIVIGSLLGGFLGLLVTLLLCYLCAVLAVRGSVKQELLGVLAAGAAFLGATVGAVTGAKYSKVRVLITGAASGVIFLIPLLALVALLCGELPFGSVTLRLVICAVAGGVFGGVLCLKRKTKRQGKRKKRTS